MKKLPHLLIVCLVIAASCKKEEKKEEPAVIPTVSTSAITNITYNSVVAGGDASAASDAAIIEKGVCWDTMPGASIGRGYGTQMGSGNGAFSGTLTTDMKPGKTYYAKAFARNRVGTAYGNEVSFTTILPGLPTIANVTVITVTDSSATVAGEIISDGGGPITSKGIIGNSVNTNIPTNFQCPHGPGIGSFSCTIYDLHSNTAHKVKAYAADYNGVYQYGTEITFTTLPGVGDSYQGGVIAYILKPGDPGFNASTRHGIIAAAVDQSTATPWALTLSLIGGTSQNIGSGQANTSLIVNNQGAGTYAAKICDDLTLGGYSDWYLPSLNELTKIYLNKTKIGGFAVAFYWSSSEDNTNTAWQQSFNSNSQAPGTKISTGNVRAVRSF